MMFEPYQAGFAAGAVLSYEASGSFGFATG
jgi:hypothetical protein